MPRKAVKTAAPPLRNQVAVVTGGGSGIGAATALRLAEAGARVVLVGRRHAPLEKMRRRIAAKGGEALVHPFDLSEGDPGEIVAATRKAWRRVDLLVNNAALYERGTALDHGAAAFDAMFATNVRGAYLLARAAAAAMVEGGRGGAIVNVSSTLGLKPVPGTSVYAATKAAVNSFTQSMALDLAAHKVRVNAVCPGIVDTAMHWAPFGEGSADYAKHRAALAGLHPLGRVGTPGEVAALVAYLCGPEAAWITGALFPIDGGINLT